MKQATILALMAAALISVDGAAAAVAQTAQLSPAPAAAPPAPGVVDLATSRVYVFVGKTGLGHSHAVAGLLQAGRLGR